MSNVISQDHPFIDFNFEVRRVDVRDWVLLGQVVQMARTVRHAPVAPDVSRRLYRLALVRGAHATTAIEGNTLDEEQVAKIADGTATVPPSKQYMATEIKNMLAAYAEICVHHESTPLTPGQILAFHKDVYTGLKSADDVLVGEWRQHRVAVTHARYRAPHQQHVPEMVNRLVAWLENLAKSGAELSGVIGVLAAILGHLYVAWIHPFGDGNGRTARLVESLLLMRAGFPITTVLALTNHYNATRSEYYRVLDICSSQGVYMPFVRYALQGLHDGMREQAATIEEHQLDVAWENHVHRKVPGSGETAKRRRLMVLGLSRLMKEPAEHHVGGWTKRQIPIASPEVWQLYREAGERTIARDLNAMIKAGLMIKIGRAHYRPVPEVLNRWRVHSREEEIKP